MKINLHIVGFQELIGVGLIIVTLPGLTGCEIPSKFPSPGVARDPLSSGRGQSFGNEYFVAFPKDKERLIYQINSLAWDTSLEDVVMLLGQPDDDFPHTPKNFSRGPFGRYITYYLIKHE